MTDREPQQTVSLNLHLDTTLVRARLKVLRSDLEIAASALRRAETLLTAMEQQS